MRGSTEVDSVGRDQTTEGLGRCLRDFRLYIYIYISHMSVCEEHHFLKSLLNLLQFCFCFMFCFFGCEACGILAPQPGIRPTSLALEDKVLIAVPPGKSTDFHMPMR